MPAVRYHARRRLYRLAQARSWLGRLTAYGVAHAPLGSLRADLAFARAHADCPRLSPRAIAEYSDDRLSGYADEHFAKGGAALADQQRGLILPLLDRSLGDRPLRVLEVGTGNGDVAVEVARRHPSATVAGVDFSVATARRVHASAPVAFYAGYALDLDLPADLIFCSSTAVVFTPRELAAYLLTWRARGVTDIVLNEPWWSGYRAAPDGEPWSHHLEGACWFHQYGAYLRAAGYQLRHHETRPYRHPRSRRPDIQIGLIWAHRHPSMEPTRPD